MPEIEAESKMWMGPQGKEAQEEAELGREAPRSRC